jgi:hypothetical protein
MCDVLFVDAEAGDLTIATVDQPEYAKAVKEHMDVVRVDTFKKLARVQEFLKAHCMYRDQGNDTALKELEKRLWGDGYDPDRPPRKYQTVITDSLTEVEAFSMYQLLGITDRTRLDEEVNSAEWPEFKKNHSQILRMIRAFRDLPMNVIFVAASQFTQNDQKKLIHQPDLTGKLSKKCQGFMDIVGYLVSVADADNKRMRRLMVQPGPNWDAKCRFSNLKVPHLDNPTMKDIMRGVGLLQQPAPKEPAKA